MDDSHLLMQGFLVMGQFFFPKYSSGTYLVPTIWQCCYTQWIFWFPESLTFQGTYNLRKPVIHHEQPGEYSSRGIQSRGREQGTTRTRAVHLPKSFRVGFQKAFLKICRVSRICSEKMKITSSRDRFPRCESINQLDKLLHLFKLWFLHP